MRYKMEMEVSRIPPSLLLNRNERILGRLTPSECCLQGLVLWFLAIWLLSCMLKLKVCFSRIPFFTANY